jgi:hypothetical protein
VPAQAVPSLAPHDGDHPGADPGFAPVGAGAAPHGEHRVLQDFLAEGPLADDKEDLGQHDPAVALVELGHGGTLGDPGQQAGLVAISPGPPAGAEARAVGPLNQRRSFNAYPPLCFAQRVGSGPRRHGSR